MLITGGASGIGFALAKLFSDNKSKVIICGRNPVKLREAKEALPGLATIQCDISSNNGVLKLVNEVQDRYNKLNIVINNAGIQYNYELIRDDNGLSKIDNEIATNLIAPIQIITLLLPLLSCQETAAIVNISSGLALVPKESAPVYCATKAALHMFSKSLRYQLENTSIKVYEIIPPLFDTDMVRGRGKWKITPDRLAEEFATGFKKDRYELLIGKVKLLKVINRILPGLAEKIMKKGV